MGDELDDVLADLGVGDDAPTEQAPTRRAPRRRTVLGTTTIEAGGPTTYDEGGEREEIGPEIDIPDTYEPVPEPERSWQERGKAAPIGPTVRQRARWEVETGQASPAEATPSPYWDALVGSTHGLRATPTPEQARTQERYSRLWDQMTSSDARLGGRDPLTPIVGEDLRAQAAAARIYQALPIPGTPETEARAARAMAQAPEYAAVGDVAAMVPYAAVPVPGSWAGRIGLGAATGAAVGASHEPEGRLGGALVGGAVGGATAGAGEVIGAALRGPSERTLQRLGERADDALLASTEAAGRGRTAIAAFDRGARDVRASRAAAAGALRETEAVPRLGTIRQVAGSVDDAMGRVQRGLEDIRSGMDGGGPSYRQVAEHLRQRASEIARSTPEGEPLAEMLEQRAIQYAERGEVPLDYDALVEGARRMRQMGMGRTAGGQPMSISQDALSEVDDIVRDAYDDAVEAELGAGARQTYQQLRRQYRALRVAQGNARSGEASAAGNRGFGLSEQLGMYGGGAGAGAWLGSMLGMPTEGGAAGLATALLARGYRATEPTIRRSFADALYAMAQRYPQRLGRLAEPILEAGQRGSAALMTTLYVLSQRDAEARRILEEAQPGAGQEE